MPNVRIWTVESDNDAKAVKCLANQLATHLQLGNLSIRVSGKKELLERNPLRKKVQNYLREEACVIFVVDLDGPMSMHQRRQEPNSLINQVTKIVNNRRFAGRVFLAQAVQELEAWLLIDCLGIFCYFASKRAQYRENCRNTVSADRALARWIARHQRGNTENITETQIGGKGPKEYLVEFSEQILRRLNPNMPQRNLRQRRYRETMSPDIAEHVVIDRETLRRNHSLRQLGELLAQFK